jgi:tRNA A37 N6-isopentenylltransferase MiaA
MKGVPHHMIGVVDRTEKFDVVHFRDQALPMVSQVFIE